MGNDADFLNNQRLLAGLTIRARAAYYLAVAESVFAAAPPGDGSMEHAREAMNMAWQWIEGASVEAVELHWYLENEDTGLQFFIKNNTSVAVSAALSYVIWRAYQAEGGENNMGETICEVTEEMIVELHHFAEQTGRFDHQLARRLLNYLRANYATSKIDDLGGAILRRDLVVLPLPKPRSAAAWRCCTCAQLLTASGGVQFHGSSSLRRNSLSL